MEVYTSSGVKQLFGYRVDLLIGRKINFLMPGIIAQKHDQYLQRYIQEGNSDVINRNRNMYAINRDGHLISIILNIQICPFTEFGFCLSALIRRRRV